MLDFATPHLPPEAETIRAEVREFLHGEAERGTFEPRSNAWTKVNRAFSARCSESGYIGMTWPRSYGGRERSPLAQFVVTEEMLAAGAPVGGHWLADRQSGPQILRFGSARARQTILPEIVQGRCCFAIGMSEPDSGSDLASVRTRAERTPDGWRIEGRKVWTTNAHNAQYMTVLCRTDPKATRHEGLSQLLVKLPDPAVTITPIRDIAGNHEFNEVVFDGCLVPDDMMLGKPGDGWNIVVSELALERSGPDRFMSTFPLLERLVVLLAEAEPGAEAKRAIGRLAAHAAALRQMSLSVAGMIERGQSPQVQAAAVKELGSLFEQEIPEIARRLAETELSPAAARDIAAHIDMVLLEQPSFSLRGGTREILRTIIAKAVLA